MDIFGQLAAVGVVLAMLSGTLWWLRRRGIAVRLPVKKAAARKLECLERLPLGPQHTLHLVRLGEMALLVAASPSGCALVESLPCRKARSQARQTASQSEARLARARVRQNEILAAARVRRKHFRRSVRIGIPVEEER